MESMTRGVDWQNRIPLLYLLVNDQQGVISGLRTLGVTAPRRIQKRSRGQRGLVSRQEAATLQFLAGWEEL